MSAFSAIFDILSGDATLMAILAGGTYDGLLVADINRQLTPAAYDEYAELRPCGLLKPETATPWGPLPDSGRLYVMLWLYAQTDYTAIEQARERAYQLLHRQQLSTVDGIFDVRHANDVLGAEVAALNVPTIASRYVVTLNRG
jgi:hypothetical protein